MQSVANLWFSPPSLQSHNSYFLEEVTGYAGQGDILNLYPKNISLLFHPRGFSKCRPKRKQVKHFFLFFSPRRFSDNMVIRKNFFPSQEI